MRFVSSVRSNVLGATSATSLKATENVIKHGAKCKDTQPFSTARQKEENSNRITVCLQKPKMTND